MMVGSILLATALATFPQWSEPRAVTKGPHEHLLASYFAIDSWSPNKRFMLVLETDLNGRLPEANERCTLGVVDLEDGNRFIPVTTTACWNFQEAAMAHWMNDDEIIFNDVRDGSFRAVVMNWRTKKERVPMGSFYVPPEYRGTYWRCDLHARFRPDGRQIAFNSVHEGSRQVYVRDIKECR